MSKQRKMVFKFEYEIEQNKLFAEIGRFIVEFESILHTTKEYIKDYFDTDDEIVDKVALDIIMNETSASQIAKQFRSISLHFLDLEHSNKDQEQVKSLKKIISNCCKYIIEAGELRNDIVHSSWFYSDFYGNNMRLEANRSKLTSNGIEMRKLTIESQGVLNNSVKMLKSLDDLISYIFHVVSSPALAVDFFKNILLAEGGISIDFEGERKKLFINDTIHYPLLIQSTNDIRKDLKDGKANEGINS